MSFLSNLSGYHNLFSFFLVSRNFFCRTLYSPRFSNPWGISVVPGEIEDHGKGEGGMGGQKRSIMGDAQMVNCAKKFTADPKKLNKLE